MKDKALLAPESDVPKAVLKLAMVGCGKLFNMDLNSLVKDTGSKLDTDEAYLMAIAGASNEDEVALVNAWASALDAAE